MLELRIEINEAARGDPPPTTRKLATDRRGLPRAARSADSITAFRTICWGKMWARAPSTLRKRSTLPDGQQITWDPEADRRIKRSPFLMRRFIRKRIEERVASRGRTHVTEADVDESASMYRQYRFN